MNCLLQMSCLLTIAHGWGSTSLFEDLMLLTILLFPISLAFVIYSMRQQLKYFWHGRINNLFNSGMFLISNFFYAFMAFDYDAAVAVVLLIWAIGWLILAIVSYQRHN